MNDTHDEPRGLRCQRRRHRGRDRPGDRRPGEPGPLGDDLPAVRGPRPARGRPRARARPCCSTPWPTPWRWSSAGSSSRPTSCRPTSSAPRCSAKGGSPSTRARLRQPGAGRRGQPGHAEDAVGAARGDAGTPGVAGRHHPPAAPAVLRHGHAEPARDGGHLPAARGAARPVPAQGAGAVPRRRRAGGDPAAHHRHRGRGGEAAHRPGDHAGDDRADAPGARRLARAGARGEPGRRHPSRSTRRPAHREGLRPLRGQPRGAQAMVLAGKARALLDGRLNVSGDDIRELAPARCATGWWSATRRSPTASRPTASSRRSSTPTRPPLRGTDAARAELLTRLDRLALGARAGSRACGAARTDRSGWGRASTSPTTASTTPATTSAASTTTCGPPRRAARPAVRGRGRDAPAAGGRQLGVDGLRGQVPHGAAAGGDGRLPGAGFRGSGCGWRPFPDRAAPSLQGPWARHVSAWPRLERWLENLEPKGGTDLPGGGPIARRPRRPSWARWCW